MHPAPTTKTARGWLRRAGINRLSHRITLGAFTGLLALGALSISACAEETNTAALQLQVDDLSAQLDHNEELRSEMSKSIDRLYDSLYELERKGDSAYTPSDGAAGAYEERIVALEERLEDLEFDVASFGSSGKGMDGEGAKRVRESIQAVRDELGQEIATLKQELAEAKESAGEIAQQVRSPQKSIDAVAERLELSPEQRAAFEQAIREGKQGLVDVLQVPTTSGRVFLDEIFDAYIDGGETPETGQKIQDLFLAMAEEPYPGGGASYLERIGEIQAEINAGVSGILKPEQWASYQERWSENPTDIELGPSDPIISRIIERAQWRNIGREADSGVTKLPGLIERFHASQGGMPKTTGELIGAGLLGTDELNGESYADYTWQGRVQNGSFVGSITARPRAGVIAPDVELEIEPSGSRALYYDGQKMSHLR